MPRSAPINTLGTGAAMLVAFGLGLWLAPAKAQSKCVETALYATLSLETVNPASANEVWTDQARLRADERRNGRDRLVEIDLNTEPLAADSGLVPDEIIRFTVVGDP